MRGYRGVLRLHRQVLAPIAEHAQGHDDHADQGPRGIVGDMAERDIAEHHPGRRPRHEFPKKAPLSVGPVGQHRDEVAEYQQRQHQAGGLLAGKYVREQRDGEKAEAHDAGLRDADHQRAEDGAYPLQWFGYH